MTALTDRIATDLRDYVIDGDAGSGDYNVDMTDLREILTTMATGAQWITDIQDFLAGATLDGALVELGLGQASSPTFTGLTLTGGLTVDTTTLIVNATTNRVGIKTASPTVELDVTGAGKLSGALAVGGALTVTGGAAIDGSTFNVDATNNRVGVGTASPSVALDVVGEQLVTASGADAALRVVQTGSGYAFLVEDAASTDGSPFAILGDGKVINGYTASVTGASSVAARSQLHETSDAAASITARWSANPSPAIIQLLKSRGGSVGTRGLIANNDTLGRVLFGGDDGTNFIPAGEMVVEVDGVPGTNDMPGRFVWSVTPDGGSTVVEQMRLDKTGLLSMGGYSSTGLSAPASNQLAFTFAGTERIRMDASGRTLFGYTAGIASSASSNSIIQVNGTSSSASIAANKWADDALGSALALGKSRGAAIGTRAAVQAGDIIASIAFDVDDGTNFIAAASIRAVTEALTTTGAATAYLSFRTANGGGTTERWRIPAAGHLTPGADNTYSLATSAARASVVYSATGTINTSDANEKNVIGALDASLIDVGKAMVSAIKRYQWLDAIAEKGIDNARVHIGPTAQAVEAAFYAAGLDPAHHAAFCSDAVVNDNGAVTVRKGLRPDQTMMLMIASLDARLAVLEAA